MYYRQMGRIPQKRHTMFKKENGSLYREQVMGTRGFSGTQSILYHHYMPTEVVKAELRSSYLPEFEDQQVLKHRLFLTDKTSKKGDGLTAREYILREPGLINWYCCCK